MAKRKENESIRPILEAWEPPDEVGEAIGCVAMTFTFDPGFFEEHCLSRFLRLETDPREDGAAYLIEREEKLAVAKRIGARRSLQYGRQRKSALDGAPRNRTAGYFPS